MRFVRATIALAVVIAAALAPSGATAAATASARSPFSISPPLRGRPHIVPTATGGALVLPNGLHADLGGRRPVLRSDGRSSFSYLLLFGEMRLHGERYGMSIQVYRDDDPRDGTYTGFFLGLGTAWGTRSPRYSFAVQEHLYEQDLRDSAFRFHRRGLSAATVDTGRELGRWGLAHVRFHATDPVKTGCGGRTRRREGVIDGAVRFTPLHDNGFFGTIRTATLTEAELVTSTCRSRFPVGGGDGQCPTPYVVAEGDIFDGNRYRNFFVSTGGLTPTMGLESAVAQESWPRMSVMHDIFASVPERWIRDDGRSVSFRGSSRTFLPGVATVRAVGDPYVDGPYPCDGGTVSAVSVDGMLTGVPGHPLTARFDTGEVSAPLPPDAWYGGIGRLVVTTG